MNLRQSIPANLPIKYMENWLMPDEAKSLFHELIHEVNWQSEEIMMFGKKIIVPRKVAWFGEKDALYRYSGVVHHPLPWRSSLKHLQERLAQEHNIQTNSVLCNLYRDGQDYMGWHQDNEKELGKNPVIASISLGTSRKFIFRKKETNEKHSIILDSGSLLIMKDACQEEWQHSLPKMTFIDEHRINLTFRKIFLYDEQKLILNR